MFINQSQELFPSRIGSRKRPHVTVVLKNFLLDGGQEIWDLFLRLQQARDPPTFRSRDGCDGEESRGLMVVVCPPVL